MLKEEIHKFYKFFLSGTNKSVFVICFFISILFWCLIKFSKEYIHYLEYSVDFVNIPIDKYPNQNYNNILKIKVNGFGFSYLRQVFKRRNLKLDFSRLEPYKGSSYYWVSKSEKANLSQKLDAFSIIDIYPDTIFVNFSLKTKKTVQVNVPREIIYKDNFSAYGECKISPSYVDVYGPSHLIDSLSIVHTQKYEKMGVFQDINVTLPIIFDADLISSKIHDVNFIQEVASFTQINMSIPIEMKNVPSHKDLKIKPSQVDLSFWVALQDVSKVKSSDFKVFCDYNESKMTRSSVLNVFIDDKALPSIVQRVKYYPTTIEFITIN